MFLHYTTENPQWAGPGMATFTQNSPSQRGVGVLISITIMKLVGNNKMGWRQWIRLPDFETAPLAIAVYAPGCLTTTGVECCV